MFLTVDRLCAGYGQVQVLHDVSLTAERGEIVTLIGANGAGKTTLMMCLSGVLPVRSGTVTFDGQVVSGLPSEQIVALGMAQCPEGRRVWPKMTVQENLEMGGIATRNPALIAERLEWSFNRFPLLKERRSQLAGSLSGGEQQMLAIARAMMAGPKLLLLDEPSLGLAPIVVEEVAAIVSELRTQGTTVILVEQNAFMALSLADRAYVLETGRVVMEGRASDLMQDPAVRKSYLGV